jgi:uracil-DNA glycosylase family 4
LKLLASEIARCRACPRLVAHRERVAREKRRSFQDQTYWGRPVPGFGDLGARILALGLAPAAHGANRTGRMFTGDRSGDFLYAALHRAGFASQPTSVSLNDGLRLRDMFISAAVRCAPPGNRPRPDEIARCSGFLKRELALLPRLRLVLCLGGLAFRSALDLARYRGYALPKPLPRFGHGAEVVLEPSAGAPAARAPLTLLGCYHPSQQNTFTGRLTAAQMDAVLSRARQLVRKQPERTARRRRIPPSQREIR